jgi:uncharacterized protein YegP (UPF0339 family)
MKARLLTPGHPHWTVFKIGRGYKWTFAHADGTLIVSSRETWPARGLCVAAIERLRETDAQTEIRFVPETP